MTRFVFCLLCIWISHLWGQIPVLEKTVLFGNVRTRDRVILREVKLKKGFPLTPALLMKEKAWLVRRNYFKRIELHTRPGNEMNWKTLMVVVQEKQPWSLNPILSSNKPFGWIAGGKLTYNNLFGRKQTAAVLFQVGAVNHFAFSWEEPWFLGPLHLFSGVEIYHKQFRYVFTDHPVHFFEKDLGFRLTLGKAWGRLFLTGMTAGIESIRVSDPSATLSGRAEEKMGSLETFCQMDSRDWPAYPFSGLFCRLWKTWSLAQSDAGFDRIGLDARFFKTLFNKHILAFQTVGEISGGNVPVIKRLHIGGGKTLRGLDDGSISGENRWIAGLEYRMPILFEKNDDTGFRFGYAAVLFADVGAAWYRQEVFNRERLLGSVGFGFHAIWDRLVLRLEWGTRGKGLGFINTGTGVKF